MIKNLYIYWGQKFINAPNVVKTCLLSWKIRNPTWTIIELNDENLIQYIDIETEIVKLHEKNITKTSFSDIVRIFLLDAFGGCWCDATTYCNIPLDDWLDKYIENGFFAFDKPGPDRLLSTWFLYCEKDNYIVKKWKQDVIKYWNKHNEMHTYFWFHYLFGDLYHSDLEFKKAWDSSVPKISAGGPHILQNLGLSKPLSDDDKYHIKDILLYKLTYKNNIHKCILKHLSQKINNKLKFIHIGKCGGTSIINHFKLSEYHLNRNYSNDENFIVWIRNPIDRFVSAFYFSHAIINSCTDHLDINNLSLDNCLAPAHIVHKMTHAYTFSERYDYLINYFQTPNRLAESITSEDLNEKQFASELMNSEIEHIYRGIGWYLYNGEFVEKNHNKIIFVGSIENMDDDLAQLSNILSIEMNINKKIRENKYKGDTYLSDKAINNLMNFYKDTDYKALEALHKYHLISDELFHSYNNYSL